ncbi:uncharacterized protein BDZ99DRAFT_526608 [Mytilinidion resinicola]|uniref:Extracellular membrane protein CFEM domain-containing protein n=1 Tax=Mytilinidion resinicola TaxID=574789 RepID=A0A6A6Y4S9_9PEZI|nr:uncharacterized protein BDZ99DRAFT_526608 [Mytilinidion resinicola]KAF2803235.1 hypothetical protein BDZ99DRAFT_526608 [Mytilinidion resinicola]
MALRLDRAYIHQHSRTSRLKSPAIAPRILLAPLLFALGINFLGHTNAGTVSISQYPLYQQLRGCAQCCYWECNARGDFWLANEQLSCGNDPIDGCFCRSDLIPVATSYLSNCAYSSCGSNLNDMTSAVAAYTEYCKHIGQVAIPTTGGALPATTQQPGAAGAYTVTMYVTATVTVYSGGVRVKPAICGAVFEPFWGLFAALLLESSTIIIRHLRWLI